MTKTLTPTWAEVIDVNVESHLSATYVSMPAVVDAYDAVKGTVEVVPLLMVRSVDINGNVTARAIPKLVGVPVLFQGGGGARMTFPLKKGDFVTLLFADRSMDVWKGNGSATPVDPGVDDMHALADAMAIPGLRPTAAPWKGADAVATTIGTDNGPFQGAGLGARLRTELDALWDAVANHTHAFGTLAGAETGETGTVVISGATAASGQVATKQTVESASVKVSA